jgi:hypothetical protein
MNEVLRDYVGKDVAINYREAEKYRRAVLAEVFDHHFTIHPFNDQTTYHIRLHAFSLSKSGSTMRDFEPRQSRNGRREFGDHNSSPIRSERQRLDRRPIRDRINNPPGRTNTCAATECRRTLRGAI